MACHRKERRALPQARYANSRGLRSSSGPRPPVPSAAPPCRPVPGTASPPRHPEPGADGVPQLRRTLPQGTGGRVAPRASESSGGGRRTARGQGRRSWPARARPRRSARSRSCGRSAAPIRSGTPTACPRAPPPLPHAQSCRQGARQQARPPARCVRAARTRTPRQAGHHQKQKDQPPLTVGSGPLGQWP